MCRNAAGQVSFCLSKFADEGSVARPRVEERTFEALRKLLLAHPDVSPADFKEVLREQWAIVTIDERAAIEALLQLLPTDGAARQAFLDAIRGLAAAGDLSDDARRRLSEIELLLEGGSRRPMEPPAKTHPSPPSGVSRLLVCFTDELTLTRLRRATCTSRRKYHAVYPPRARGPCRSGFGRRPPHFDRTCAASRCQALSGVPLEEARSWNVG